MDTTGKTIANNAQQTFSISTNVKAGIFTALGMIFYFVIMKLLNLHHHLELHYLNVIILFLGLRYAIKHIVFIKGEIKYFEGLKSGIVVTLISVIIFNIFMVVYETIIDPAFLILLNENIHLGNVFTSRQTIFNVMGLLTAEGFSSGFIMTFILMQYYKAESSETK
jgi:hypothetical protein